MPITYARFQESLWKFPGFSNWRTARGQFTPPPGAKCIGIYRGRSIKEDRINSDGLYSLEITSASLISEGAFHERLQCNARYQYIMKDRLLGRLETRTYRNGAQDSIPISIGYDIS